MIERSFWPWKPQNRFTSEVVELDHLVFYLFNGIVLRFGFELFLGKNWYVNASVADGIIFYAR